MGLGRLLTVAAATVSAVELTPANWDKETGGKQVFIKFLAPWCGHCKSMKPDWDKLIAAYKGNPTSLVADVDCTAAGEPLCQKNGVKGYPSIKYGDPTNLKDYQGGRDFNSLKSFADDNLGPKCSAENVNLCSKTEKEEYEKWMGMSNADVELKTRDLRKEVKAKEAELKIAKDVGRFQRKKERDEKAKARKAEKEAKKKVSKEKDAEDKKEL